MTAEYLKSGRVVICEDCRAAIREFQLYAWDTECGSQDKVKKEHDHAMDEIRYFVSTIVAREAETRRQGIALAVER